MPYDAAPMTLVAVPIFVDAPADVPGGLARAESAVRSGARIIEWRVDRLAADPDTAAARSSLADLVRGSPAPCIVTCRPRWEGGRGEADEAARVALLEAAWRLEPPPKYVDVELAAYGGRAGPGPAGGPRPAVSFRGTPPGDEGPGLIVSRHDFDGRPADLLQCVEAMTRDPNCAVIKIAWTARSLRDNLEAFDLLSERRRPMIALCMGEFGLLSRALAPKFGGLITFASAERGAESAPGQPTIDELKGVYRFDAVGPGTSVYGVIGWPVGHSLGPRIHNAGFAHVGHDGVYLPLPIPPEYEHFKATVGALVDHPRLGFAGASVTLPHKEHLVRFVAERGGRVEARAEEIGSANTLLVGRTGATACINTDAAAAVDAVRTRAGLSAEAMAALRVAVLGAGGVARAVVAAFGDAGADVVVFGRSDARARELAAALGEGRRRVRAGRPEEIARERFDVYVNCTPVGMAGGPDPGRSPLPPAVVLDDSVTVFDTVYTPERTPLIREADARGARVVTGLDMFVRQAALQFEEWTGAEAPLQVFRDAIAGASADG